MITINKNNPYFDGRVTNGGFRAGAGRKGLHEGMKYINVPIAIDRGIKGAKLKNLRKEIRVFLYKNFFTESVYNI